MASVLIVDDDPFIRKLVCTTLEDVAGVTIVEAANGEEALEMARAVKPSIVFLDIDMPVLDGTEACRLVADFVHAVFGAQGSGPVKVES